MATLRKNFWAGGVNLIVSTELHISWLFVKLNRKHQTICTCTMAVLYKSKSDHGILDTI